MVCVPKEHSAPVSPVAGGVSLWRSLRGKLLLSQIPLVAVLLILSLLALLTVSALGESARGILHDNYRSVQAAQHMKAALERLDRAALLLLAEQRTEALTQAAIHRQVFETELRVAQANITEPGEAELAQTLAATWSDYRRRFEELCALGEPGARRQHYVGQLGPAWLRVGSAADGVLTINQDAMERRSERARRAAAWLSRATAAAAVVAIALGLLASTLLTTRLLRPLARLSSAVRRLGGGDLAARAPIEGQDELAQLAVDFNAMADRLQRYRQSSLGELLLARQAAQAAIASLPDPVLVLDGGGRVLHANEAAATLLSVGAAAAGEPLSGLPSELASVIERVCRHVLAGRGPYVPRDFAEAVSVRSAIPGGEGDRYLLPRAMPVYGELGGVYAVTLLLQDVTRLRRFDELKDDLVATVAHELRTPLTSLRMSIHLCLEGVVGAMNAKQAELLTGAREDCQRLQIFIDDLLDLARLQAGRLAMHPLPVGLRDLLDDTLSLQHSAAAERGVTLASELSPQLPPILIVDPERIGLVFSNLLANAIRHTPEGGQVCLRARPAASGIRFEIRDSGPGIPREYQREIFQKFFRIPDSPGGAAGLGLSIAREIVEAHGGEIGVDSEPGQGCTFYFELPQPTPAWVGPAPVQTATQ